MIPKDAINIVQYINWKYSVVNVFLSDNRLIGSNSRKSMICEEIWVTFIEKNKKYWKSISYSPNLSTYRQTK